MRIQSTAFGLLVAVVAAGCGGRSSLAVQNDSPRDYVLRVEVERNATFGFAVPPGTTASAWQDQAGSIFGWAVLMTHDCQPVGRWRLDPTGGRLQIDAGGSVALRADPTPTASGWLDYSSACFSNADGDR